MASEILNLDQLVFERTEYQKSKIESEKGKRPTYHVERYSRLHNSVPENRWFYEFGKALLHETGLRMIRYSHMVAQNEMVAGHFIMEDTKREYENVWGDDFMGGFDIYGTKQGRTENIDLKALAKKRGVRTGSSKEVN